MRTWKLFDLVDTQNRRVVLDLLEENKLAKVLDCGCGDGAFTKVIGRKIGTDDLYGVDINEKTLQLAAENGINVYRADLNKQLPLQEGSFDVVHANQVIEHILETDVVLKEVYRILKVGGGYAIISVPNLASFHNIISLFLGWQPPTADVSFEVYVGNPLNPRNKTQRGDRKLGHIRLFTYRALKELLKYHGFKIVKITGVGYYPFPKRMAGLLSKVDARHSVYLTLKVRK